jgi:hypothetical protein
MQLTREAKQPCAPWQQNGLKTTESDKNGDALKLPRWVVEYANGVW